MEGAGHGSEAGMGVAACVVVGAVKDKEKEEVELAFFVGELEADFVAEDDPNITDKREIVEDLCTVDVALKADLVLDSESTSVVVVESWLDRDLPSEVDTVRLAVSICDTESVSVEVLVNDLGPVGVMVSV